MKRILLVILLIAPILCYGQRMEVYTYNSFNYLALYAYGLPRSVVKTNAEMRESTTNGDGTGIMRRHHTTKGVDDALGDDGFNANKKLSFAFMASPYNVNRFGKHTSTTDQEGDLMTWSEASGWDTSIDVIAGEYTYITSGVGEITYDIAETPTGCAAYKGMNDTDKEGDWRLPTQREIQVMFTVIEQALVHIQSGDVVSEVLDGVYWTSTEFFSVANYGQGWSISNITGQPQDERKTELRMTRCVKDIYETIND